MAGKTSKPTFFWQGVLILLPVLLMAGFGTWAILRERRAVESDARQRAREILQSLPYLFNQGLTFRFDFLAVQSQSVIPQNASQIEASEKDGSVKQWGGAGNIMPGEATNGSAALWTTPTGQDPVWPMNFLLDTNGNFWDLTYQEPPQPPDWFTDLNVQQRSAWVAMRTADLGRKPAQEISKRADDFLNTSPPAPARECAEFISLRAQLDSESGPEALDSLFQFATNCSDARMDTGVPLSNLVMAELLRRTQPATSNAAIQRQLEFEVRYRPSVLMPALLDKSERFGASDKAFAERLKMWRALERAREVQRGLAEDIKFMGVQTETGSLSNFWIQTPEQRWFCILQPEEVLKIRSLEFTGTNPIVSAETNIYSKIMPFPERFLTKSFNETLNEAHISLPIYFGISIELQGQLVDLPAPWAKPLIDMPIDEPPDEMPSDVTHILSSVRNLPPPEDILAEQQIVLSQPSQNSTADGKVTKEFEALPSHPRLTLRVVLADRGLLYARQRQRQIIFGGLMAFSVVAALVGFVMARRAFTTQLQLSEAKSNFVSSVSHELRAPIASVRLMAESLERGKVNEVPKQNEYFRFIVQECRRLSSLIENVLDFSRIEQGRKQYEFEPTDLAALTRETVKLMEPYAAERGVTLETSNIEHRTSNIELEIDGRAMQQALVNLMDNAIKHSPKGAVVNVGFECDGSLARLWVEDRGPGIPPEEHEKIFERFYRLGSELRRETQGVGIGLSIVRHIVEAHGGKVTVRSSVGQGSRFTIELPASSKLHQPRSKTPEALR
jgi:signal transduction histidine kinase